MGRTKETAEVDIIINNDLQRKKIQEMTADFDDLRRKKVEALKAGNGELAKSIQKEMSVIKKELTQMQKHTVDVDHVLRNLNKVPLSQLQEASRKLRSDIQGMDRDSVKYMETRLKLDKVESEIAAGRSKRSGMSKGWAIAGGAAALALFERYGSRAIEVYARLDDKMADVMKTTGMTKGEVVELDKQLLKIDTRTSREELLDLARVAGKLGIAKQDVEGFVRAGDQIKVALSEDLGGNAEVAIQSVGKLVDIFHLKGDLGLENAMLSTASAINSLGASSTANEGYMVEFANRMAGIAPKANISIQSVLGLGATLDSIGQPAQVASTAVSQAITGMARNTEKYAKIAGMSLKEFKDLYVKDANEAFLRFLEGLNKGDGGMIGMTARLDSLGLKGKQSTQVLGALAGNVEKLREQQAISNGEFAKATSITDEYNTKNSSAQAIIEKRKKAIQEEVAMMGQKLMPLWSDSLGLQGNMLRAVSALLGIMFKYKGVLIALAVSVGAYNVAKKLQIFYSKQHRAEFMSEAVATQGAAAGTKILAAAKALLAGNVKAASVAMKGFWASLGPIGWIITGITLLSSAFSILSANTKDATKSKKDFNEINKRANETYAEEKVRLEQLLVTAGNKAKSDKERLKAMEELQRIIPNGIDLINEETVANGKAKTAVDNYCKSLLLRAKIEAAREKLVEIEKERLDKIEDGKDKKIGFWQSLLLASAARNQYTSYETVQGMRNEMMENNQKKFEEKFEKRGDAIVEMMRGWQEEIDGISKETFGGKIDNNDDDDAGYTPPKEEKGKWSVEKDQKFMTQKIELRKKLQAGEIQTEEEYNRQLLDLEIEAYQRRIAARQETGEDMLKLQSDLADKQFQQTKSEQTRLDKLLAASLEGGEVDNTAQRYAREKADYEKRLKDLGLFNRDRASMTELELAALLNLERIHTNNLQKIYVDRIAKQAENETRELQRSLSAMKIRHNAEFADADSFGKKKALLFKYYNAEEAGSVRTSRQADRLLKKHYQKLEEEDVQEHLKTLLAKYKEMLAGINDVTDGGVALGIMDPEEVERIQGIIDKLNQQLSDLRGTGEGVDTKGPKVDVLGFSMEDWTSLFDNLAQGEMGLQNWQTALGAVGNAFSDISNLMTALEKREFKNFEKTQNRKKEKLERDRAQQIISQDGYNAAIQALDAETDAKRAEMERKQAAREKALAVFQAIVNTAVAVTSALKVAPPWGIVLAATIGALGLAQIATIVATPTGYEDGGPVDVARAQDGKRFRAKNDPDRRGPVNSPTLLVAENGPEYVVPNEGYDNPTVRPVLDIIEQARRNGTLGSINLPELIQTSAIGRASGGYAGRGSTGSVDTQPSSSGVDPEMRELIKSLIASNDKLGAKLDKPFKSYVSMTGKGGFKEAEERYNQYEKNVNISK